MTRINLLPPERVKVKRRGPRSYVWLVIVLPLVVAAVMGYWYFSLNSKIAEKNKALDAAKAELADWQAKNAQLQQYKTRLDEISKIEQTVVTALSGRIYWARILNEVAIMCPSDVWLTSLNGASGGEGGGGTVDFQGYALQCTNRYMGGFYRYYPDYRPVANWLDRMAQIPQFEKIWLSSAQPIRQGTTGGTTPTGEQTGPWVISFSSQATLNAQTAAINPTAPAPAAPAAAPTTPPSGETGGETK